jgi:hypothetical protein
MTVWKIYSDAKIQNSRDRLAFRPAENPSISVAKVLLAMTVVLSFAFLLVLSYQNGQLFFNELSLSLFIVGCLLVYRLFANTSNKQLNR